MKTEKPKFTHHYLMVVNTGPLMVIRVPWDGAPKARRARWREILTGLTAVMKEHGLRQKDIYGFDPLVDSDPWLGEESEMSKRDRARLDAVFETREGYEAFHLYDFYDGKFNLVRKPTKGVAP